MKNLFIKSLRFRTITFVLLGVVPPMLVAIWYASIDAANIIHQEAKENLSLRAHDLADNVSRWDQMNVLAVRSLSEHPLFANMDEKQHLPNLSTIYRLYNEIYGLTTLDLQGNVITEGTGGIKEPSNYSEFNYFKRAISGEGIVRESLISGEPSNKPAIIFASPIRKLPTLKLGTKGASVTKLQKKLQERNYYYGPITGIYDSQTSEAVFNYQSEYFRSTINGITDPLTFDLIRFTESKNPLHTELPGKIVGVAVIATLLSDLSEIIGTMSLGKTGYAFLVDEKGQVLAHHESKYVSSKTLTNLSNYPPVRTILDGNDESFSFTDKQQIEWLSYGIKLKNGWNVIALQQESEVLEKEQVFLQLATLIAVVAVLSVVILIWLLTGRLLEPISRLTLAAKTLSKGQWHQHVSVKYQDEVGTLANAFNQMSKQLRVSFAILQTKNEESQKAREEAEKANKAKSVFVANMTHELRTPLNAIIGYSEMLQEEAEDMEPEEFVPDLEKIASAGRHLLALINDVLDFSKVEAGKMELYLESFQVNKMINEVVAMIQPAIQKNSNELIANHNDDLGTMHSDITKIRQCLFNLLSNSSKFTESGTINLTSKRESKNGEDWVIFQVADTGIGMTEDQMSKVFQAFTQADSSTTRKYGGTGLGLVITRQFCLMMGGKINVESEFGNGSTFTIELPVAVKELQE
ncbi:ATP-binding protein [Candidatus Halobeggiatoa sp. HSG11]|nr:ATP-binding protein [Candidatus Halobeggiatoa sp. HSG11]